MNCEVDVMNWLEHIYNFSGDLQMKKLVHNAICEHGPSWGNQVAWADYLDNLDIDAMVQRIIDRIGPDYYDERSMGML